MKLALLIIMVLGALILLLEWLLRRLFGFGTPLTYVADADIGYLLAPNQTVKRFGNRIEINRFSMRGGDVSTTRPADTLRVFLLGDSIANGGWWTDQANTISEMIAQVLRRSPLAPIQQVEVLNASANSWCPRNQVAYLQRFGRFESQVVVLLINTDDLFGIAPTSIPVGRDRNYPDRLPSSALSEVLSRYLIKQRPIPELAAVQAERGDRVGFNLEAIRQIQAIAQQGDGLLLVAITPLLRELGQPGPRDYELTARQRLMELAVSQHIPLIDFLPIFNAEIEPKTLYRDHIHLTAKGNQLVSQHIVETLTPLLKANYVEVLE